VDEFAGIARFYDMPVCDAWYGVAGAKTARPAQPGTASRSDDRPERAD
jgi:hypothetical protein